MDDEMKDCLKEFFKKCYSRLEMGEKGKGNRFKSLDLFEEMADELADISNYAFLQYVKLTKLKEKIKTFRGSQKEDE